MEKHRIPSRYTVLCEYDVPNELDSSAKDV